MLARLEHAPECHTLTVTPPHHRRAAHFAHFSEAADAPGQDDNVHVGSNQVGGEGGGGDRGWQREMQGVCEPGGGGWDKGFFRASASLGGKVPEDEGAFFLIK